MAPWRSMLSTDLVQSVLECAPDAIVIVDGTGAIAFANRQVRIAFGYQPEELLGHPVEWLLPEFDRTTHLGSDEDSPRPARATHESFRQEFTARRKDGSEFPVEVNLSPVYTSGHTLLAAVIRDVTEQRQLQVELQRANSLLRESYHELKQFVVQAPIAIALLDRDMRYVLVNDRWTVQFGKGHESISGLSHYELFPDLPEHWRAAHRKGLAGEIVKADADFWIRNDGTTGWLRWAVAPWRDKQGNIGGIFLLADDVTGSERIRELERHVRERTAQLHSLVAELETTEFRERESIARDLHDDLGQLLAAARIRLLPLLTHETHIVESAAAAVNELLERASSATRALAAHLAPASLHERGLGSALSSLVEDIERTFPIHIEIVELTGPDHLSDASRSILYRAARELLINAAKHGNSDHATLECESDDAEIILRVIDDGVGFDPSEAALAAQCGSGLASIRRRIRLIGGSLEIHSRPGEGTTVILRAPTDTPPHTSRGDSPGATGLA